MSVVLPGVADAAEYLDGGIAHGGQPPGERLRAHARHRCRSSDRRRLIRRTRRRPTARGSPRCGPVRPSRTCRRTGAGSPGTSRSTWPNCFRTFGVFDGQVHHGPRGAERVGGPGDEHVVDHRRDDLRWRRPADSCGAHVTERDAKLLAGLVDPAFGVTEMPGEDVGTAKSPVPSPSSASTSRTSAAAASGTASISPRSTMPSPRSTAATAALSRSRGPTVAMVVPSAMPVKSCAAVPFVRQPGQRARRGDRGRQPRPRVQGGAEFFGDDAGLDHRHAGAAVFLRHQQPGRAEVGEAAPHLHRSVPVGSSSSGRTCPAIDAFSARKRRVVSRSATCSSVSSRFICAATRVRAAR